MFLVINKTINILKPQWLLLLFCCYLVTTIWYHCTVHDKNVPILHFVQRDWTYWRLNDGLSVGNWAGKTISIVRYSRRAWRWEIPAAAIAIVSTRVVADRRGGAAAGWLYYKLIIIIICYVRHTIDVRGGWLMRFHPTDFVAFVSQLARVSYDSRDAAAKLFTRGDPSPSFPALIILVFARAIIMQYNILYYHIIII